MQGVATQTSTQREGQSVVPRFLIETADGTRTPVEMRGREIRSMVSSGDRIEIDGRRITDRDGVARPTRIRNVTTRSLVHIRRSRGKRTLGSAARLTSSVAAGVLAWPLTSLVLVEEQIAGDAPAAPDDPATDLAIFLPVAIGVLVALGGCADRRCPNAETGSTHSALPGRSKTGDAGRWSTRRD